MKTFPPSQHTAVGRRAVLRGAGALVGLIGLRLVPGARVLAQTSSLFSLGVASGDPTPRSVLLWTRLAPDPLEGGGMPAKPVRVRWEVARDEGMRQVVRRGQVVARPADGHTVHAVADGLAPDSWYYYRFSALGETSRIGRTRTMPAGRTLAPRLRLAVVSCQDYQNGYYAAYRDIVEQGVDFVVHTGDYIYEYGANPNAIRQHRGGECRTLEEYRNRYALYRLDPQLQDAHARFPFLVTWDDHEVENNYTGPISDDGEPVDAFRTRRAVAYQAYWEHMPLRAGARPRRDTMQLYRRLDFGRLARIFMLDGRQFRSDQPCVDPGSLGVGEECPAVYVEDRTFLGTRQERWLYAGLRRSRARWNVLAQQVMMMRGDLGQALGSTKPVYNMDAWDGYQAQRQRILDFLAREKPANPVVLTGDIHSAWVAELRQDFLDPASPIVAVEFVCTSISSSFLDSFIPIIEANLGPTSRNPHIRFFEGRHRGWTLCDVTPEQWRADFRIVENLRDPQSPVSTAGSWIVDAGAPGVRPA